ncbi:hypothetical protein [Pseudomonas cavernicola]|nr:hypothetical protein [Pseudomonas cavernicola]
MSALSKYQSYPANIHRKFYRAELLEDGYPPEVVSAFLGDWLHGEEPYDDYSSFSPLDYASTLNRYLSDLLRKLGWKP